MHRTWQWLAGLLFAGVLLVLLPAPDALAAESAHPLEQEVPTCPTVEFTKTVAVDADPCAGGTTAVEITAGTPIYYCYKLTNPISSTVDLTLLALLDGNPPIVVPVQSGDTILAPGQASQAMRAVPSALQPAITETSVTTATWNFLAGGFGCTATSNATTVSVVRPRLQATLRVASATADPCIVTTSVNDIGSSATARYCLQLTNVGNATFDSFVINIPQLGIDDITFAQSVAPNQTANLTSAQIPQLQRTVREPEFTAEARVIGQTNFGLPSEAVFNAATSRSAASITVRKVVTKNATGCPDNSDSPLVIGQTVYLCYIVTNNGPVELLQQSFTDSGLNVSASFVAEILTNGTLRVNNDALVSYGAQPVLGPLSVNSNVNGSVTFVAQNQALGFYAQQSTTSGVSVVTPTPRPTNAPAPTSTPLPFATATMLPTMTPFPPTPTATPTWTPPPTWTPAPTVIIFTTPGGQVATPYPAIGGGQPPVAQQPTPADPFAQTATASAATATAVFFQTQGIPGGDPFAATATAIFLQTQSNPGGYPAPGDPFAATATAIFLQTQGNPGGYPAPADPFAATATAIFLQTQGNPGGYPAPADPFAATATAGAATATALFMQIQANPGGQPAPAEPFAATATASAATATALFMQMQGGVGGQPTPADPFAATATANAQPGFAPNVATDVFAATATAQAALSAPGGYPPPNGDSTGATATAAAQLGIIPPQSTPAAPPADAASAATTAAPDVVAVAPPPVIVTPTPDPNVTVLPTQRAVDAPTPASNGNLLALLASVLDSAVATLTFLGLLAGAGLFFAVAVVLIVLTVRTRRPDPYDLTTDDAATFAPEPPAEAPATEDHWPTSLP